MRTVCDAGIHGLAHFLIDPGDGPIGGTGDKPAVLIGVLLEIRELAFELALLGVALQSRKNGRIDLIGRIIQGARVNGGSRGIGIGKLLRQRRKRGNGRAYGVDLSPAQGVAFIHAIHNDGTRIAVEEELIFAAGLEPVNVVFPIAARRDVQAAPFVQVILERQRLQSAVGDGRIMGDVLIRSLHGELAPMFHKVIRAQSPGIIAEVDGEADAGQNRHLKKRQALENGSQRPHCAHKAQRHPQGTETFAERRSFVGRSGHGDGHDPQEQGGNDGQGHQIESAEKLQHQLRRLRTAKARAPGIPPLAEKGVQNMLAGVGLQEDFRSGGEFRCGHSCPPCRCWE